MEQVDDDISDAWQVSFEAFCAGFLAQSRFENASEQVRNVAEVGCVDIYGSKGTTRHIEFVT